MASWGQEGGQEGGNEGPLSQAVQEQPHRQLKGLGRDSAGQPGRAIRWENGRLGAGRGAGRAE